MSISITIEGLDERIGALSDIQGKVEQANNTIYQEVGDFMVSEMRSNAHVITGFMKSSITYDILANGVNVEVTAPYAVYENARGPPHDFADQAFRSTEQMATQIVKREYDYIFSSL